MRSISIDRLLYGDVLLSFGRTKNSHAIRLIDGSEYSHAALWAGDSVIESILQGVVQRSLGASLDGQTHVQVYRHAKVASRQTNAVVEAATRMIGGEYAGSDFYLVGALLALAHVFPGQALRERARLSAGEMGAAIDQLKRQVRELLKTEAPPGNQVPLTCSALVATAFHQGGFPLTLSITGRRRLAEHKGEQAQADPFELSDPEVEKLLGQYLKLMPSLQDNMGSAAAMLASLARDKALVCAGKNWPLGLVTPRDVSTALDHKGALELD